MSSDLMNGIMASVFSDDFFTTIKFSFVQKIEADIVNTVRMEFPWYYSLLDRLTKEVSDSNEEFMVVIRGVF